METCVKQAREEYQNWYQNQAGRLWDGEAAFGYIQDAFRTSTANNLMNLAFHCNEWKLHHEEPEIGIVPYQFQMDGNEAIAMAMLLMLLDEDVFISEDGAMQIHLYLLPALPIPRRMLSGAGWGGGAWAIKSLEDV